VVPADVFDNVPEASIAFYLLPLLSDPVAALEMNSAIWALSWFCAGGNLASDDKGKSARSLPNPLEFRADMLPHTHVDLGGMYQPDAEARQSLLKQVRTPPDPWDPTTETESAYRQRIDAYVEAQKTRAEALGWSPVPAKRVRDQADGRMVHFKWLVERQLLGKSYKDIADEYGQSRPNNLGEDAVRKAVVDSARLAGLKLR
jgi:hypothetical protein